MTVSLDALLARIEGAKAEGCESVLVFGDVQEADRARLEKVGYHLAQVKASEDGKVAEHWSLPLAEP